MSTQVSVPTIPRIQVVQILMRIRHEWEDGAQGDSLIEMDGSVGYLLYDIAEMLGLTDDEKRLALGSLVDEIDEY